MRHRIYKKKFKWHYNFRDKEILREREFPKVINGQIHINCIQDKANELIFYEMLEQKLREKKFIEWTYIDLDGEVYLLRRIKGEKRDQMYMCHKVYYQKELVKHYIFSITNIEDFKELGCLLHLLGDRYGDVTYKNKETGIKVGFPER